MKSNELQILQQLRSKAQNISLSQQSGLDYESLDIDWKYAYHINSFLEGKVNSLPRYPKEIEKEDVEDKLVSIACGVVARIKDQKLIIEAEDPISDNHSRIDVITGEKYSAYETYSNSVEMKNVDLSEAPRFEEKRIAFLQDYILKYNEKYKKENSPTKK